MQNMTRREALAALAGLGLTGFLGACGNSSQTASSTTQTEEKTDDVVVRVASLKGPTTIGLVNMMNDTAGIPADGGDLSQAGEAEEGSGITYAYQMSSAPDEVLPLIIQDTADIALVPSNAAAVLYAKTKGKVQVIDLNTLGVLSVVTGDSSIQQFEDLAGKTIYISGKGSSPEYVMNYLLEQAGIADTVTMEWQSEHTEVASVLASDPTAVGVLPQPFTTATLAQNSSLSAPVDLTDVWEKYAGDTGSSMLWVPRSCAPSSQKSILRQSPTSSSAMPHLSRSAQTMWQERQRSLSRPASWQRSLLPRRQYRSATSYA